MAQRDVYIDRLRSVMTAIVVVFHTAITYGSVGGWFYHEVQPSGTPSSLILTFFVTTNQAYFMGFFFLLAGYFTPASLERKGYARFTADRFLRLGLPLLAFGLIIGPLTAGMVSFAHGDGFWPTIVWLWKHKEFINGPLWFAQALLIFSLAYCAWRAVAGSALNRTDRTPRPVPAPRWWLLSALAIGAAALAIRQFIPVGQNVFGLQLGYFASYIVLFAVGIAALALRLATATELEERTAGSRRFLIAWPLMPRQYRYCPRAQWAREVQLQRRPVMARDCLCGVGAVCGMGTYRRMAAGVSRAHEPAVGLLELA